jgi:PKD domain
VVSPRRTCLCLLLAAASLALAASASARQPGRGNLGYGAGPVLHSSAPYLVFWTPTGESIPASSERLIERFFADSAADSGKSSNVFGVIRQYYDAGGFADYRQTFNPARQVIVDAQPYPPHDPTQCAGPTSAYPTCVSDGQIRSELQRLIRVDGLPTAGPRSVPELSANAPIYFVILPADVEVCETLGVLCTGNKNCGWHGTFIDRRGDNVLYAPLPLQSLRDGSLLFPDPKGVCQLDSTSVVQDPNGDVNADLLINLLSHEYSETITDPIAQVSGWFNTRTTNEIGDDCESSQHFTAQSGTGTNPNAFLPTLGGSEAAGTLYTQLINGHSYYLQSEWSNGDGNCEMRPSPGRIAPRFAGPRASNWAGIPLTFNPAASNSRNTLSSATWNFGDGTRTTFSVGHATLGRIKHRYHRPGRYTVTLTLVDNGGNLASTTRHITVYLRRSGR